jgi:multiple sugar transport system permease protein
MTLTLPQRAPNPIRRSPKNVSTRRWSRYSSRTFYLFVSPWVLGFFLLTLFPLLYSLMVSFTNWDGVSDHWRWIGARNYLQLFHDPDTILSLERTSIYVLVIVPVLIACGLGLALLLNNSWPGIGLFRAIFYIPSIVPIVASVVAWRLMFDRDAGALNAIIEHLGGPAITWLIDPAAFGALIIMIVWGLGGGMIISLAALQGIPTELLEAAQIDGANYWQVFRSVTLPLLSPVLFFQVITNVIAALQTLIQPLLLAASGGAAAAAAGSMPRSNYFFMVHVYVQFLYNQRFGYGSALLWVFFVFILLLTLLIFRSGALWVYYEVEQQGGK